jgi:hypothetical protein
MRPETGIGAPPFTGSTSPSIISAKRHSPRGASAGTATSKRYRRLPLAAIVISDASMPTHGRQLPAARASENCTPPSGCRVQSAVLTVKCAASPETLPISTMLR